MSKLGILGYLAYLLGATEPALKLLLSLLFGYPLAAIYHSYIKNKSLVIRHVFFGFTGFSICCFNYGFDVFHSFIAISITYVLCRYFYKYKYFALINFLFNMGYLLIGYYFTESNDYDIKWTMPHCVLVLRLIGFGFDVSDGQKNIDTLSKEQLERNLRETPSFLESLGFFYFPASFLVGPQFPFQRYNDFVHNKFDMYTGNIKVGLKRGGLGIFYLLIRQIGATILPDNYILSTEFAALSLPRKIFTVCIWGKISLYKYVSCWLITEGALMCFGLTYNETDKTTGVSNWDGCSNVNIKVFELATKMEHYVKSFNVNTNQWVASYVYKRLKFLGNRTISYASALFFLAMWHGFHSGYYMSFMLEYTVITFEKQFNNLWSYYIKPKCSILFDTKFSEIIIFILMKIYNTVCMGWCMVPFVFLSYNRWLKVYASLYHYGYIFLALWFILHYCIKSQTKPKIKNNENTENSENNTKKNIKNDDKSKIH